MRHVPRLAFTLLLCWLGTASSAAVAAADFPPGCDTFSWDVARELAALQTPSTGITAGSGPDDVVRIELDTHYQVRLPAQSALTFAARPGKPMLDEDAYAGLLTFQVPGDGRYRVAITSGHWIDLVEGEEIVRSLDFQGRRACPLVHKIVEFELHAGRDLVLQFAGGNAAGVGVVITAAP